MKQRAKVLVACEYSGVVREAFRRRGHDAWSCDILPAEDGSEYHFQEDVKIVLPVVAWDLIIAHPPCTHLSVAGNRHYANRPDLHKKALYFATMFFDYAPRVAVENPIGRLSSLFRKPDQIVHPYHFGHPVKKATCLWLKGLPLLEHTSVVEPDEDVVFPSGKRMNRWYYETSLLPQKDRAHARSRTFEGIAEAMAEQWGPLLNRSANEN